MKRILLFSLVLAFGFNMYAQNCVVDNNITQPGIYPEYLDTAKIDEAYEFTIQVLAIADTMVDFMGSPITATIDSVKLWGVGGLPGDFDFACEPTSCVYTNAAVGCVKLFGNPTKQDVGVHPLEIYTTAYARFSSFKIPQNDTIRDYQLVVRDTGSASIHRVTKANVDIFPNPTVNGQFTILTKMDISDFNIYDLQGRSVEYEMTESINSIEVRMLTSTPGVYFIQLRSGDRIIEKRIMR